MSRPSTPNAHFSSIPPILITSPGLSTFPFSGSRSNSISDSYPNISSSISSFSSSSSTAALRPAPKPASKASAWRSHASELRDLTHDLAAARATSTDAKTKSYTESEIARFEAMARNAELMAGMAAASKRKNDGKGHKKKKSDGKGNRVVKK